MHRQSSALALAALALTCLIGLGEACDTLCQWNEWKVKYGKTYESPEEEARRYANFGEHLAKIERLREEEPLATFAVNEFSDMSGAEFASTHTNYRAQAQSPFPELDAREMAAIAKRQDLPTNWKSDDVTPPQNQGACGSCWAFAAVGCMEAQWKHTNGAVLHLSEQQLVDCDTQSSGCNGGDLLEPLQYAEKKGMMLASDYKYTAKDGSCKYSSSKVAAKFVKPFSVKFNEATNGVDAVLKSKGPLIMGINADTLENYDSGILKGTSGCKKTTNHAVLLVGWGVEGSTKYWIIKNSWGATWGEKGFFRLARGSNACMITTDPAVGVAAVAVNPKPSSSSSGGTCKPSKTCGTRVCGTVDNGCGVKIKCGSCTGTTTCNSDGQCVENGGGSSDWAQFYPAGQTSDFTVTGKGDSLSIATTTSSSTERRISWTGSDKVIVPAWTKFTAKVTAGSSGTVGLGMRLQADGKGLAYKFTVGSSSTTMFQCYIDGANDQCTSVVSRINWKSGQTKTVSILFGLNANKDKITMVPYLDGVSLLGKNWHTAFVASYPETGRAFVLATGGSKTFAAPALETKSGVRAILGQCMPESEWRVRVASMLGIDDAIITDVVGTDRAGSCAALGSPDDLAADDFSFGIFDSHTASRYAAGKRSFVEANTLSSVLSQRLIDMTAEGAFANSGVEVLEMTPFVPEFSIAATAAFVPVAALSAGAIAGIVIGSVVAGSALVAGAAVGGVVIARKLKRSREDKKPESPALAMSSNSRHGVDIMNSPETKPHVSITARAPPSNA